MRRRRLSWAKIIDACFLVLRDEVVSVEVVQHLDSAGHMEINDKNQPLGAGVVRIRVEESYSIEDVVAHETLHRVLDDMLGEIFSLAVCEEVIESLEPRLRKRMSRAQREEWDALVKSRVQA